MPGFPAFIRNYRKARRFDLPSLRVNKGAIPSAPNDTPGLDGFRIRQTSISARLRILLQTLLQPHLHDHHPYPPWQPLLTMLVLPDRAESCMKPFRRSAQAVSPCHSPGFEQLGKLRSRKRIVKVVLTQPHACSIAPIPFFRTWSNPLLHFRQFAQKRHIPSICRADFEAYQSLIFTLGEASTLASLFLYQGRFGF